MIGRRGIVIGIAAVLFAAPAEAYYHYVHYLAGAPATPVFEKFDLTALPYKTVTFLVNDAGPTAFAPGDDFSSVLSQLQQAVAVWNGVSSSDLRVEFGGLEAASQAANTPGVDVVFGELPPGLLGLSGPTVASPLTPETGQNGTFIPIVRSTVMLSNDTNQGAGPSYLEAYFTTAVHEMGHALGLQHTFTGAAMSQAVIRNTSRTRPIDLDDIAGLSMLYGKANYGSTVGSISGQVLSNGQPVALASVVALTATGPAVSTLTNPDGTYEIDGLPPNPNGYRVYVHPAPPDTFSNYGIKGPYNANGLTIAASGPVESLFYPGTRDVNAMARVPVVAGAVASGINFSVQSRTAVPAYDLITYSYSGDTPVTPAFVNTSNGLNTIKAQAAYTATPIPQSVTVLGFVNAAIRPYGTPPDNALALDLLTFVPATGPRHVVFDFGNDMYVLPDGVVLAQKDPPAISAVTANADGTATVSGANFGSDSQVYFDGLPATVVAPFSGDPTNGSITVLPPPGYNGQTASVIIYGADEQNSTFYQTANPPTYTYPANGTPQVVVTPQALPAGTSGLVDITSSNMQVVDGQVTVGFGSSDVLVQRTWVLSPTHLIADVAVAAGAAQGSSDITVTSGFQTAFQPLAFQTQAASPGQPAINAIVNADSFQQTLYTGAYASAFGSNLAAAGVDSQVTVNSQPVPLLYSGANQINFQIPAGIPNGPAIVNISNGTANSLPFAIQVDTAPPAIVSVNNLAGQPLTTALPASAGDLLVVVLSGVDPSLVGSQGRIQITVSGIDMPVFSILAGTAPGTIQVMFQLNQSFGGIGVPLKVLVDSAHTDPVVITAQ